MNAVRTRSPDPFWTGMSLGVLLIFTAANIFLLLFVVPKFGQIYADALPGMPLPFATRLVLGARIALVVLNAGWLSFCFYFARRHRPNTILFTNVGTIWTFAQAWLTVVALAMPMTGSLITSTQ